MALCVVTIENPITEKLGRTQKVPWRWIDNGDRLLRQLNTKPDRRVETKGSGILLSTSIAVALNTEFVYSEETDCRRNRTATIIFPSAASNTSYQDCLVKLKQKFQTFHKKIWCKAYVQSFELFSKIKRKRGATQLAIVCWCNIVQIKVVSMVAMSKVQKSTVGRNSV